MAGLIQRLALVALLTCSPISVAWALDLLETPALEAKVKAGALLPVGERVPSLPLITDPAVLGAGRSLGKHGGTLRTLMAQSRDTRQIAVYGSTRLISYDQNLELVPDIVAAFEVEEERRFTFHLRPGHRWSDGAPFTAEDFRFYWQDYVLNEELSPYGAPLQLLVDGQMPAFEMLDEWTVRFTWEKPNPFFLPALAGPAPLNIYQPAHYLKQFHAAYAIDRGRLDSNAQRAGKRNWAAYYNGINKENYQDNPDLPTLNPWVLRTSPPADRFVFVRNPYFHRVDSAGRQLPYIDEVVMTTANTGLIPAKAATGETDLQARYVRFSDYTFLKNNEDKFGYDVRLWRDGRSAQMTLRPNLNTAYYEWEQLIRDVRFRRALSLGIDREEINQVVYFGLSAPTANAILPQSPLFKPDYRNAWTQYDPVAANALLDEMGLTARNSDGIRLLPDNGEPMQMIIETAGESGDQVDVLELITDHWAKLGIKLFIKTSQREVFRGRIMAGEAVMTVWSGHENGVPTPDSSPAEFAPTSEEQYEWPAWGQYYSTKGVAGYPIDLPEAQQLLDLNMAWIVAPDRATRASIWHEMLNLYTDQVFSIGIIAEVPQPVVVSRRLRNIPLDGLWNWDPGSHFGLHRLDLAYFAD